MNNTVPYDAVAGRLIRARIVTVFTGYVGIPAVLATLEADLTGRQQCYEWQG